MNNTSLIFISGAGLRKYIWDDVINNLDSSSFVIDYSEKFTTLNEYVDDAMRQIAKLESQKFIVVAHSAGGVIAVEVAKRLNEKLVGFIAISAIIPEPTRSFVSSLPFPQKIIMPIILKLAGTTPPEASIRNSLAKGLSLEQQDRIVKDFRTEGIGLYRGRTSSKKLQSVATSYLVTTEDTEFDKKFQILQAKTLGAQSLEYVESGHLPMISHAPRVV